MDADPLGGLDLDQAGLFALLPNFRGRRLVIRPRSNESYCSDSRTCNARRCSSATSLGKARIFPNAVDFTSYCWLYLKDAAPSVSFFLMTSVGDFCAGIVGIRARDGKVTAFIPDPEPDPGRERA